MWMLMRSLWFHYAYQEQRNHLHHLLVRMFNYSIYKSTVDTFEQRCWFYAVQRYNCTVNTVWICLGLLGITLNFGDYEGQRNTTEAEFLMLEHCCQWSVNRKGRETGTFDLRHCDGNARTRKAHNMGFNLSSVMPADRHFHVYHDFLGGRGQVATLTLICNRK
jgi:hypothetical protein